MDYFDCMKIADDVIKIIQKNACFYEESEYGTKIYYPTGNNPSSFTKVIDGKLYDLVYSNHYDELVKFFSERNVEFEQLKLF